MTSLPWQSIQYEINQLETQLQGLQAQIKKLEEKKPKMPPNSVQAMKTRIAEMTMKSFAEVKE